MKMYLGNCTQQNQVIFYRLPGIPSPRQQEVRIGTQIQIAGELTPEQIDSIVNQLRPYGMVRVDEIDRTKPFIGMCYQMDKPIKIELIMRAIEHNKIVLTERGQRIRQEAAVATTQTIEQQLAGTPGALKSLEIEVSEVPAKDGMTPSTGFNEGLRVTRDEDAEHGSVVPKSGGRGRKGR